MTTVLEKDTTNKTHEYVSGESVEPGVYVDVESGAIVRVVEPDELPEGRVVMRYRRRFHKVEALENTKAA